MSHDIENLFVVGAPAWHKLGTQLENAPSIAEGIIYAGLNWSVELQDLYLKDGRTVPNRAVVRNTDKAVLGVVGTKYTLLQNADAFKWFEPFLKHGNITLESAGSLQGGRKVWILAKIGGTIEITPEDHVNKYILLANSHDGSMSITTGFTPIRVVCNNTLSAANVNTASKLLKVRHTQSASITLDNIREIMNTVNQTFEATGEQYRALQRKILNRAKFIDIVKVIMGTTESKKSLNQLDRIVWLWENGKGNQLNGVRGSAWAGYNGITEYFTHYASSKPDNALNSVWFGNNAKRSQKALTALLKA